MRKTNACKLYVCSITIHNSRHFTYIYPREKYLATFAIVSHWKELLNRNIYCYNFCIIKYAVIDEAIQTITKTYISN